MSPCYRQKTPPVVGLASPDRISNKVLFPEPLGPIIKPSFWGGNSKLMAWRIALGQAVG
jgi:hypothetical protein